MKMALAFESLFPECDSYWGTPGPLSTQDVVIIAFYLWMTLGTLATLWVKHRRCRMRKKLFWTFVILFVPMGWLLYLGLFKIPEVTDIPLSPNANTAGGSY